MREEELVKLRRRHGRARQHGVRLPAVVDLADEQVAENGGHRFPVVDAVTPVDADDAREARRTQAVAKGDQPPVGFELGRAERRRRVGPIYEVSYEGKTLRVAITVGSNGYIVGANMQ